MRSDRILPQIEIYSSVLWCVEKRNNILKIVLCFIFLPWQFLIQLILPYIVLAKAKTKTCKQNAKCKR